MTRHLISTLLAIGLVACSAPQQQTHVLRPTAPQPTQRVAEVPSYPANTCAGAAYLIKPAIVYPPEAMRREQPGWVLLAFDILPDGTTSNVRVVDSSPKNTFESTATKTMTGARFTATEGGFKDCYRPIKYSWGGSFYRE